ncbi:uncharacterized protein LOC126742357 [Anthonomus grandis grandis]|uniref:uncharacterized protein LOC126742357 n=1 Tax=Anthonomus grandis grandis TaxID=2921223 RepID=UPI0021667061|nr:uncharacterized protein LOC126742357 [Anthonomus grandis grandis]XP_050304959.1 uncharacterized protein LOC126742357 [Anthonomus grandis grandis]
MTSPAPTRSPTRSRSQTSRRPRASVHSDCPPEADTEPPEDKTSNLGQRSVSLTTLQPTVQPRMSQLETLEAKMASIEVSLSNVPRRKKLNTGALNSSIRSIPKELAAKELENLRNALKDKENIIQSLRGQLTVPGLRLNSIINGSNNNSSSSSGNGTNNNRELTEVERKQAEDRLARLKTDIDNKRLAIKNLKMALERLDITDNIDVRIQQAELEYQLGREELNLLTLLEETRALQLCIEESNKSSAENNTLYSCIDGSSPGYVILHAIATDYDPQSPKFGAGQKDNRPGLWIDWALDETGLLKGDRLIEVNGKIVLTKTRDDLTRLLAAAPDPAQLVVLRPLAENFNDSSSSKSPSVQEIINLRSELKHLQDLNEDSQRVKDELKSDNIRLTHRISYLEEQVSELLGKKPELEPRVTSPPIPLISKSNQNVTNINITSQHSPVSTHSSHSGEVQLFQKGPQVTTLVTTEKEGIASIRSRSSMSNVSNTLIAPSPEYHKHRHKSNGMRNGAVREGYEVEKMPGLDKVPYRKHHHHHHPRDEKLDYSSETNSNGPRRRNIEHRYSADFTKTNSEKDFRNGSGDLVDQSYKKATKIIQELTRSKDNTGATLYEKHRQRCITASEKYNADILKHYNARKSTSVLDFRSEVHIGPKYCESKSVEDLDESPSKAVNKLYKKIQSSRSVKSLDFDSDCNSTSTRNGGGGYKSTDYNSEADYNQGRKHTYYEHSNSTSKPRPPKKPLRLSLHKTHSMQSMMDPVNGKGNSSESSRKRNYKGSHTQIDPNRENSNDFKEQVMWNCYRRTLDNGIEQGTWC